MLHVQMPAKQRAPSMEDTDNTPPQDNHANVNGSQQEVDVQALVDRIMDEKLAQDRDKEIRHSLANFTFGSSANSARQSMISTLQSAADVSPPSPTSQSRTPCMVEEPEVCSYFDIPSSLPSTLPSHLLLDADPLDPVKHSSAPPLQQVVPSDVLEFRKSLRKSPEVSRPFEIPVAAPAQQRPPSPAQSIVSSEGHARPGFYAHARSRSASVCTNHSQRKHSRRGSIASFAGFGDLNTMPSTLAEPRMSSASIAVLHLHQGAESKAVDVSLLDEDLPSDLRRPITPAPPIRRQSLQPLTSIAMVKGHSDPGYHARAPRNMSLQISRFPTQLGLPESDVPFQFPSQPSSPVDSYAMSMSRQTSSSLSSRQVAEEADTNPLYVLLSTSQDPDIKDAWHRAGLVLLPPRQLLPSSSEMLHEPTWVKGHAFEEIPKDSGLWSSLGYDWNATLLGDSVTLKNRMPSIKTRTSQIALSTRPLLTSQRSNASLRHPAPSDIPFPSSKHESDDEDDILLPHRARQVSNQKSIKIKNETVVYRKAAPKLNHSSSSASLASQASQQPTLRQKLSSSKLRAARWLQRASFSRPAPSIIPERAASYSYSTGPILERVRVLSLESEIWAWTGSKAHLQVVDTTITYHKEREVPLCRNLFADLTFFIDPDLDDDNTQAIHSIIAEMASLCQQFAAQFVYVKGFERYTAQRIRRGILDKIWNDITPLFDDTPKLFQMVENIVLGFVHHKIYTLSIKPIFETENQRLASIATFYRASYDLRDFGLSLHVDCSRAILVLSQMNNLNSFDLLSNECRDRLYEICSSNLEGVALVDSLYEAKTPFDTITIIKMTIDELVRSADSQIGSRATGTDDILPLLAFTIVKAGLNDLDSLLFYIKNFTQTSLGPEYDWALVTFQAAIAYLRTDPLGSEASALSTSPVSVHVRRPSPLKRRHTDDQQSHSPERSSHRRSTATSPLLRTQSGSKTSSDYLSMKSAAAKSTTSLVDLDDRRFSMFSQSSSSELHQTSSRDLTDLLPKPATGRDRHLSDASSFQSTALSADNSQSMSGPPHFTLFSEAAGRRESLESNSVFEASSHEGHSAYEAGTYPQITVRGSPRASRTAISSVERRGSHVDSLSSSTDMRRGASDGVMELRRNSLEWTSFYGKSQIERQSLISPRSSSPSNSTEEGSYESWTHWTRRRLSSVTSLGSFSSHDYNLTHGRKGSDTAALSAAKRTPNPALALNRTQSLDESDTMHTRDPMSPTHALMRQGAQIRPRPLSSISLASSTSDADSGGSPASPISRHSSLNNGRRRHRSGRLRRDLLSSSTSALPPHIDTSLAGSFRPTHSPIREMFPPEPLSANI